MHKTPIMIAANTYAPGTHEGGQMTLQAQEAVNYPYRFVRITPEGKICPATDSTNATVQPASGVVYDVCDTNEPIAVHMLGAASSTRLVRASKEVQAGDLISTDKSSEAIPVKSLGKGSFFAYGQALSSAKPGQLVEFAPALLSITQN